MEIIETKLGDISEIITGPFGSQLHQSDYVQHGIPSIMPQNIGNRLLEYDNIARISEADALRLARYTVKQNDIVYARRGDIEKHAFIRRCDEGALCGTGCMRIRVDPQKALPAYVSFFLNRPESKKWISQHAVGSNMPNLNTEILSSVPIQLPCMQVQQSIVCILECIDDSLNNNNQLCSELESMAKTLYDYWFVQFDFPDVDGKPYRASGGEMVWNDQLKREIPKGWVCGTIGELGTIISGGTPSTSNETYYSDNGIAWITPNDLSGNESLMFIGHGERDITSEGLENSSAVLMPAQSVLFSSRAPIGYIAIANNAISTNQGFKSVVPDKGYGSYIIYYTIKSNTPAIARQGVGTTFKEVSGETLKMFKIVLPPMDIAGRFEEQLISAFKRRRLLEEENRELTKLRDWLLPMLMNGQATVMEESAAPKLAVITNDKLAADPRFDRWLQTQGVAARGNVDEQTLHDIFDAMDDDDKQ